MNNTNDTPEDCPTCDGNGCEEGCGEWVNGCDYVNAGPDSHKVCPSCHGSGRTHSEEPEVDELEELMAETIGLHPDGANRFVAARLCAMVARGYYALKDEAD